METLNSHEFLENEYPLPVRIQLLPMLQSGLLVAQAIFNEYPNFYSSSISSNIRGKIVSYAIMLQFTPELGMFPPNRYDVNVREVNTFRHSIVEISTSNSIMHITKSPSHNKLPSYANYKKELALRNDSFDGGQLEFAYKPNGNVIESVGGPKKYILFCYGSRNGKNIEFAHLNLPNAQFTGFIDEGIDLFKELRLIKNDNVDDVDNNEKALVNLKQSVLDKLNINIADIEP